jgi:hypothetical protein
MITVLAWAYSIYFILTGIWPIVSIRTFMMVTGPKTDIWLVRTVGLLVTAIGLAIAAAAWKDQFPFSILVLAIASSLALLLIDVVYVLNRTISRIYLLDAVLQAIFIAAWGIAAF